MRLDVSTSDPIEVIDVTGRVDEAVPDDVGAGVATVFVPHTTAGVVVNEAEDRLLTDIEGFVEELVPADREYSHDAIDDNAAAHLRATVLGESVSIPIADGGIALGTWQSVLFVECDGPRSRNLHVTVLPD
jgi:secondary thiamine-phosphate synthase enzyme